jgi:hypothetical protein
METEYKKTQFGTLTIIILLVVGLLIVPIIWSMIDEGRLLAAIVTIALYLPVLALFYALTVQISDGKLKFWFGIGLVSKTYSLNEIQSTKEVKDPWYYLWGVKSIPGGWLYAIAPGHALEIVFKNGKIVHLGTNQSKELKKAIDAATDFRPPTSSSTLQV